MVNMQYDDILQAKTDRSNGYIGRTGTEILAEMDRIIAEAEAKEETERHS